MKINVVYLFFIMISLFSGFASAGQSGPIAQKTLRIAVASNFHEVAKKLCNKFVYINEQRSNDTKILNLELPKKVKRREDMTNEYTLSSSAVSCSLVQSSSGKLVSQILNGASYDVFFSADSSRPEILYAKHLAEKPIVYAVGQIALIASERASSFGENAQQKIAIFKKKPETLKNITIAIANPKVAPYGVAAFEFLNSYFDEKPLFYKLITGHSAVQAYQFLKSGTVDYAVVPLSYVYNTDTPYWLIPSKYHTTINQSLSAVNTSSAKSATKISKSDNIVSKFTNSICETYWISILENHGYKKSPACISSSIQHNVKTK